MLFDTYPDDINGFVDPWQQATYEMTFDTIYACIIQKIIDDRS